jgi:hypothetical protein
MDILQDTKDSSIKTTFLSHVFSTSEISQAEIFNTLQYTLLGVIPIVLFNKLIQHFIPDVDDEKSSIEISMEIIIQLLTMICGIILIHRIITYIPTYSSFKYDNINFTTIILVFLLIILSFHSKLGQKTNILYDRFHELFTGKIQKINHNHNHNQNQNQQYHNQHKPVHQPSHQHQHQNQNQNQPQYQLQSQTQQHQQFYQPNEPQAANTFIDFR